MTRFEILQPWHELVDRYITFLQMDSPRCLERIGLAHIDFAYIDAMHDYASVSGEVAYVAPRQREGDLVLFDDAGPLYPGVDKAIEHAKARLRYVELARMHTAYRPQPWVLLRRTAAC